MENLKKVDDYLTKSKVYYLTTVDGDKPKCRPIGLHFIEDNKLYFGVGTFKEVYKQMKNNANVEICALDGGGFLRYYGKAVFVEDKNLEDKAIEMLPYLKKIYNDETGNKMGMFYLENAVAQFRGVLEVKEEIKF